MCCPTADMRSQPHRVRRLTSTLPPGGVFWMEATEHATENLGGTTIGALMFEPK